MRQQPSHEVYQRSGYLNNQLTRELLSWDTIKLEIFSGLKRRIYFYPDRLRLGTTFSRHRKIKETGAHKLQEPIVHPFAS